tara:strand:- start:1211 stop:2506 length:1296 start_codon:yes stop_codon:yes gene_type:complete
VKILKTRNSSFYDELNLFLEKRIHLDSYEIDLEVKRILSDVYSRGDQAVFEYAKKFDNSNISKNNILLSKDNILSYSDKIDSKVIKAFDVAIENITKYHKKQIPSNYELQSEGVKTSSIWNSIDSVGLYIPGGKATYPSSLIMNAIPAIVAGVKRIVAVTPSKKNIINPYILALFDKLNIEEVYQIGGPHSIGALAYGTESIKPVNKIFGPGNAYIASAKKQVFGLVGIDLLAGPSEIVVVADSDNNPQWVASDLIAQAEHDEKSQSILITDNNEFAEKVIYLVDKLSFSLPKYKTIKSSIANYGMSIITNNFEEVNKIIDIIAPEHLHLQNKKKYEIFNKVRNAGGIFLGEYSSEAFGDYIIGTNHILPTSGTAKFSSGVNVLDFMKRTSVVEMNQKGYNINKDYVSDMAKIENLEGHQLSVKIRQTDKK